MKRYQPVLLALLLTTGPAWALEDPTIPSTMRHAPTDGAETHDMTASMIRLSGDDPLALIDGQQVRVGDTLHGLKVVRIHTRGVTLRHNDDHLEVPVAPRTGIELRRH